MDKVEVYCFADGNIGAISSDGEQIQELQHIGWLGAWLEYAESLGYDPDGWIIHLYLPTRKAKVYRVIDELRWVIL